MNVDFQIYIDEEEVPNENDKNNLIEKLNSKINNLDKDLENNKKNESIQKSLIDYYENISKLKQDLIVAQEEIIKERAEQLNDQDEFLFNALQDIEENINLLKQKYEENLNKINEKYQKEIKEKDKKIEILEESYTDKLNKKDLLITKLKEDLKDIKNELEKEKNKSMELNQNGLQQNIKKLEKQYKDEIKEKNKEIEAKKKEIENCMLKSSQIKEQYVDIINRMKIDYENKLNEGLKKINKQALESIEKIRNNYKNEFIKKEEEYNTKFNQLENIITKLKFNKEDNKDSDSDDIDSDSDDMNNTNNNEIHIKKDEIKKEKETEKKIIMIQKIPEYSYECINKEDLELKIDGIKDFSKFEIILKNNGSKTWYENSKLKIIAPDDSIVEIILEPQKPESIRKYPINFNDLKKYENGEYRVYLEFYSNRNNYGERLEIKVIIDKNEEIIKHINKIKSFRINYGYKNDKKYPNELILRKLKENNFNELKTFESILNKNNSDINSD